MTTPVRSTPPAGFSRWVPFALFLFALMQELIYGTMIPPWQGPDEPRHFEYIALVARGLSPSEPAAFELQQRIIDSMVEHRFWDRGYYINPYDPANPPHTLDDIWPGFAHETHQPPLYYHLAASFVRLFDPNDLAAQLRVVRYFSAILGAGVVWLAWVTARTLFPHHRGLALGIALFVALLPMHTFIYATANNDTLNAFWVAMQAFFAVRVLRYGFRWGETALMGLLTFLSLATKRTGFIAPALFLVTLIAVWWDSLVRFFTRRGGLWVLAGVAGGPALLVAGVALLWQFARSLLMDIWGGFFHLPRDVLQLLSDGSYAQAIVQTPYPYYTRMIFESFWARFGWLNIRLADAWYWALGAVCVLAGLGLIKLLIHAARRQSDLESYQIRTLIVFMVVGALAYTLIMGKEVLFLSYRAGVVPQGRYLFPVVIPLATLLVMGLREITPASLRRIGGFVGGGGLLLLNAISITSMVRHFY